ncbi:MAG: type 3 dihydrofolate reductase [Gammaproteobacteria bacterium]|nr:type 3 dihydrofolate reductase [Gammaproteobacteria bacterium]
MTGKRRLSLIVAMTQDRVIGRDNDLPWHLSADLKHFKTTTMGKPVVMGRKTYESIGRALPGRHNIVVTSRPDFVAENITRVASLEAALRAAGEVAEVMIIGGAQLYAAALPMADRLYLTCVRANISGDTFFPEVDWSNWQLMKRSPTESSDGIDYYFAVYDRMPSAEAPQA